MCRTRSAQDTIRSATRTTTTAFTVVETVGPTMDVVQAVTTVISTVSILLRSVMETLTSVDAGTTMTAMSETSVIQTPMSARLNVWRTQSAMDLIKSAMRTTTTASTAVSETATLLSDVVPGVTTV